MTRRSSVSVPQTLRLTDARAACASPATIWQTEANAVPGCVQGCGFDFQRNGNGSGSAAAPEPLRAPYDEPARLRGLR